MKFVRFNNNLANFKAILISGPPGIGKTTTAKLLCLELNFNIFEQNSSDNRNKSSVNETAGFLMKNTTIQGMLNSNNNLISKVTSKNVIIMDEIDGMCGSDDSGGISAVINVIRNTKIPIICICNDRNNQRMKALLKYCFDIKFVRPEKNSLNQVLLGLCKKENLNISSNEMLEIIESTNYDIRQCINILEQLKVKKESKIDFSIIKKDKFTSASPFEVAKMFMTKSEVRLFY